MMSSVYHDIALTLDSILAKHCDSRALDDPDDRWVVAETLAYEIVSDGGTVRALEIAREVGLVDDDCADIVRWLGE